VGLGFELECTWEEQATLRAMAEADVLVDMGSSFAVAAATLMQSNAQSSAAAAQADAQLHVMLPPKECRSRGYAGFDPTDVDSCPVWRTFLAPKASTVPADFDGRIHGPYASRFASQLASIARRFKDTSGAVL
jgi:hypothetical protein